MADHAPKRYWILIAAIGMQMCLGATYAWSEFVAPLRRLTGLGQGWVQLPFTGFYIVFPATTIAAGMLIGRLGPRRCATLGGVLFGGGWLLAGLLGARHFAFTLIGISLLGGMGVGLAYIVPIALCIQWFPERKGLVTGLAVAGFGGGAAAVAQAAGWLIERRGATPYTVFALFGAAFLVAVTAAARVMERPPGPDDGGRAAPLMPVVRRPLFWLLYGAMLSGLAAGLMVIGNLKELSSAPGARWGLSLAALFALANALGRVGWGAAFDRLGPRRVVAANLALQAALFLGGPWLLASAAGLRAFTVAAALNYGGVLVLYALTAAREWGAERVGPVYGLLFSANIPAALAPVLAGKAYDHWGDFGAALGAIGAMLATAAAAVAVGIGRGGQRGEAREKK